MTAKFWMSMQPILLKLKIVASTPLNLIWVKFSKDRWHYWFAPFPSSFAFSENYDLCRPTTMIEGKSKNYLPPLTTLMWDNPWEMEKHCVPMCCATLKLGMTCIMWWRFLLAWWFHNLVQGILLPNAWPWRCLLLSCGSPRLQYRVLYLLQTYEWYACPRIISAFKFKSI